MVSTSAAVVSPPADTCPAVKPYLASIQICYKTIPSMQQTLMMRSSSPCWRAIDLRRGAQAHVDNSQTRSSGVQMLHTHQHEAFLISIHCLGPT